MGKKDLLQNPPVVGMKQVFPRSFGRYILEKSISKGGMGEVFLAVAKGVGKRCVIKTIRGELTGDEEFVGRFSDEAKIMVRISHDNIIRVFDAGKVDADYYIAMEYVHGRDLGDVLDRAYERGDPMPHQIGLYITSKLLAGLDYAHKLTDERGRHMGLVHRDISPQNVLIGFDGSVKLIDFGLARTDLLPARTQGALAVGKYGYMAPEQARHESIDGRADIYSTGVMLFEVFTGDRLVDEQDQSTLWQRVLSPKHRRPRSVVPNLPDGVDELVMISVEVKPEDRFQDADAMREYADALRSEESSRESFLSYLHYLYPKVNFMPPPVPKFGGSLGGSEESIIFAMSKEGALSVFGRGHLPIEWTSPVKTEDVQKNLRRPEERIHRDTPPKPPPEPAESDFNDDTVDKTYVPGAPSQYGDPKFDSPTEINPPDYLPQPQILKHTSQSQREANVDGLGFTSLPREYSDDEMTVMMDRPPQARETEFRDDSPTRRSIPAPDANAPNPRPVQLYADAEEETLGDSGSAPHPSEPKGIKPNPDTSVEPDVHSETEQTEERNVAHRSVVPSGTGPATGTNQSERTHASSPTNIKTPAMSYFLPGLVLVAVAVMVVILGFLLAKT